MAETLVAAAASSPRARGDAPSAFAAAGTRRLVRGSTLLLVGRFVSVFLNFAVQVLTVRYLAKEAYGAFAYGLGVATLGTSIALMGLSKSIPCLVPMYQERNDQGRTFGSIVLATGTIWGLGLVLVLGTYLGQGVIASRGHVDAQALSLLLVLIAIAPIDAFDNFLQQLAAVFCPPRTIFFRRQVLGPSLKLAAIALVTLVAGDVYLLAYGYIAGSLIGVTLYVVTLLREWQRKGLLRYLRPGAFVLPVRELFGFSLPMLSTELSFALRGSLVVIMLEYFRDPLAVGEFRAVLPVANMNMVVFQAFGFLFVPLASRLYARRDLGGIDELYWLTSLWIAILTFPVFVVTCFLAPSVTVWLFGQRYAHASTLLGILAVGYYFNAALGFNAATLRVHGKIRIILLCETVTAAVSVVLGLVLVNRYGALGAAIATTATLILQNLLNQFGLWAGGTGIRMFSWPFIRVYLLIAAGAGAAAALQWLWTPPVYVPAVLAMAVCLFVVRVSRRSIDPTATFPELRRLPMLRWLLE